MADTTPLWKVMLEAHPSGLTTPDRFWMYERDCIAAELRAIAEWLWKQGSLNDVAARADVIKLLYDEADRAEAGDG